MVMIDRYFKYSKILPEEFKTPLLLIPEIKMNKVSQIMECKLGIRLKQRNGLTF